MKANRFFILNVFVLLMYVFLVILSCSDKDDGPDRNPIEKEYFSIKEAEYVGNDFPQATGSTALNRVTMNRNVLAGGSSIVTLVSEKQITEIYIGVAGTAGYYRYVPGTARVDETTIYPVVLLISQNLDHSFTIRIAARMADGEITEIFTSEVGYIRAGTGALQISLSFDNEKDVDLYVVQPDEEVIYYGNEGGYNFDLDSLLWGLDVDSNAGCAIDGINNENVFYPSDYVQAGKYEVWVNMYSNCRPEIATNWVITTIYKNELVRPTYGQNPARGVFPAGTESNPIDGKLTGALKVMEFTVSGGSRAVITRTAVRPPLSVSAKKKMEAVCNR